MRWILLLLAPIMFMPLVTVADTIPEASDVVLIYDNAAVEDQNQYSFVFRANDDATVYPCSANICSTQQFRSWGTMSMHLYLLPEGFPRPDAVVDQEKLVEYANRADQEYFLEDIPTKWDPEDEGREYLLVNLNSDGTASSKSATYDKPLLKANKEESDASGIPWLPIGMGALVLISVAGIVLLVVRKRAVHKA